MKLFQHADWRGNFGDDLNRPLFRLICPEFEKVRSDLTLYGIGTVLNSERGRIENAVIFGSGFGYSDAVSIDKASTLIFGVRGPLTADALGVDKTLIIGDPGLFLERLNFPLGKDLAQGRAVLAVHHRTAELWDFEAGGASKDWYVLDPGRISPEDYVATIRGAPVVLAEAMHAAITACAYEVPFIPVSVRTALHATKWADFLGAVNCEFRGAVALPRPPTPLLRRLDLSRFGRVSMLSGFGPPSVRGASVSREYFRTLFAKLDGVRKSAAPLHFPSSRFDQLWAKFQSASASLCKLK